jgi:hypothetical protein
MSDHYEQWYESQELKGRNVTGVPSPHGQHAGKRGAALHGHGDDEVVHANFDR